MQRPRHFCSVEMVGADKPLILGEPTHWSQGHHCVSASLLTQPPQRYTAKWVAMKSHLLLALKVSPGLQLIVQLAEKRTNMRVSLQSTPSSSPAPLLLFLSLLASQQHDRCSETRHIRPVQLKGQQASHQETFLYSNTLTRHPKRNTLTRHLKRNTLTRHSKRNTLTRHSKRNTLTRHSKRHAIQKTLTKRNSA